MKKVSAWLLGLLLAFSLTACGAGERASLGDVLLGNGTFLYHSEQMTLKEFLEEESAGFLYIASVDMDGDGEDEALVQTIAVSGDQSGYLVLHRDKNQILGFRYPLKYLSQIKTDGSFFYGDAQEGGVATLSFEDGACSLVKQCSGIGQNFMRYEFLVDGKAASPEEYDAALTAQAQKPDAPWLDFTEASVANLFPEN